MTYIMMAQFFYHFGILYLFVDYLEYGIYGCAWGSVITYSINLTIITLYCASRKDFRKHFFFPNKECFEDLWDYFKIGLPAAGMLTLEGLIYEAQVLMASQLGIIEGSTMAILINILLVFTMISIACSTIGSVFVGNSLGRGHASLAKFYLDLIFGYAFVILTLCGIFLILFKHTVASFFSNDPDLIITVSSNLFLVAILLIAHGFDLSLSGGLRGMGKQSLAFTFLFICSFFVGLPLSFFFTFYLTLGLTGILLGSIIGTSLLALCYYLIMRLKCDWEECAK